MCLRAPPNSYLLIANDFSLEDQGYVGVGTAEFGFSFRLSRKLAAIAQDIDIGKGTVQGHGTEFANESEVRRSGRCARSPG